MAAMQHPGALAGATGVEVPSCEAAGIPNIADSSKCGKRGGLFLVTPDTGETFTLNAVGREAWALERLMAAGPVGVTPITQPAPRWSAYIHRLRESGVPIETVMEQHGGEFAGAHGRYILHAKVRKAGGDD